jgi:hypothetical protein
VNAHGVTFVLAMRSDAILTRLTALTLTSWLLTAQVLVAQVPAVPLVLLASAGDYPGETYTQGPAAPAEYVYFVGEAAAIDVSIANWGMQTASVTLPPSPVTTVEVSLWKDDQVQALGQATGALWRETVGDTHRVTPAPTLRIEPGDALRWRALIPAEALLPGFYEVRVGTQATTNGGDSIRRERGEFTIELRARTAALPEELARREAEWLTAMGEARAAHAATASLARLYPDSVVVHLIRSRLAEAAGDEAGARRELDLALEFMRIDRDRLFRRFARPGQIEDLIESLRP